MDTLVLFPGLISDSRVWQPLADALQEKMPIHHADTRNGDSLTAIAEIALNHTTGNLLVAGHSMGGRIALELARLAPGRVTGLILADTGYAPIHETEFIKRQAVIDLGHESMEKLVDQWLPPMVHQDRLEDSEFMRSLRDMVLTFDAQTHEQQIRALINRPDAGAYLPDINCPTLLLVGRQDSWSPVAQHQEIAEMMPNARLAVIEDAGHFAPIEQPRVVSRLVQAWIDGGLN